MPRVIHFEIQAEDPEKVADFYSGVFGWTVTQKQAGPEDYWLIFTGPQNERGINGGIKRQEKGPSRLVPTIDVPSVDRFLENVEIHGGKILQPKRVLPGAGYLAYCQDTAGNVFCLLQYDSTAK